MKIILGSASKTRVRLLKEGGVFIDEIITADLDEKKIRSDDFYLLPMLLARAKREALLPKIKEDAFLITADTVLFTGDVLLEKPESADEERTFFTYYNGVNVLEYATAVTVTNTKTGEMLEDTGVGKCTMGPFTSEFVEAYIQKGTYLNYAGGFTYFDKEFEGKVTFIDGSSPDPFLGLPVDLTKKLLLELGYTFSL